MKWKPKNKTVVGLSSFSEPEFLLLKLVAVDADGLDDNFEEYRANLERVKANFTKPHTKVIEIPLTVAEVEAYCAETNQPNNGAARAELARSLISKYEKDPA